MANREENLKKINDELEQLSDEELEKVSGGGFFDWLSANASTNQEKQIQKPAIVAGAK